MSNLINDRRFIITFLLFINLFDNSFAGLCNVCVCAQSETMRKIVNCAGKREIDNYMEIFDTLAITENENMDKLILSNHEITSLPLDTFKLHSTLKSLDLSENSVKIFEADIFKDLKNLEELNFSFNHLTTLRGSCFENLGSLIDLDLSNNEITSLRDITADQLPKLKHLNLSHNNLQTINSDFVKSLKNLQFFDISFNEIINLSSETLSQLRSISHLCATNNLLKNLSSLNFPSSLKILKVAHNKMTSMPSNVSQIRHLDIQDNAISSIDDDDELLKNLKHLNISGNLLTTLPNAKFDGLEFLDISRNELQTIPETLTTENFPSLRVLVICENPLRDLIFNRELRLQSLVACELHLLEILGDDGLRNLKGVDDKCINLTVSRNSRLKIVKEGALNGVTICHLDFSENALTRISPKVIESDGKFLAPSGIDLQGNPLTCDCQSQWMLDDLVPHLYKVNAKLLDNLRCDSPMEFSGTRLVHWFEWKNRVFCDSSPMELSRNVKTAVVVPNVGRVMIETSTGMLAIVVASMATLCILIVVGILIAWKMDIRRRRRNRRF